MALVLDNTVGGPNSNTYCNLAEADAYHSTRGFNSKWTTASTEEKNAALVWATRQLDQEDFSGLATFRSNAALRWPRTGLVNREGLVIDPLTIPQFIKNAVSEWALHLLSEDRTADEGGLTQYGGKVGPVSDPTMFVRKTMPSSVRDMLRPYLAGGGAGSGMGRVRRG